MQRSLLVVHLTTYFVKTSQPPLSKGELTLAATLFSLAGLLALQIIYWSARYLIGIEDGIGPPFLLVLATVLSFNLGWSGLCRLFRKERPEFTRSYTDLALELGAVAMGEEGARASIAYLVYGITYAIYTWFDYGTNCTVHPWLDTWGWPGVISVAIANVVFAIGHIVFKPKHGLRTGWLGPLLVGVLFSVGLLSWGPVGAIALHVAYNLLGLTLLYRQSKQTKRPPVAVMALTNAP